MQPELKVTCFTTPSLSSLFSSQAVDSAQAAQDIKIRFDSFQQQFQEVFRY